MERLKIATLDIKIKINQITDFLPVQFYLLTHLRLDRQIDRKID